MYNSIYPINIKPYTPPQNKNGIKNKDEGSSWGGSSENSDNFQQQKNQDNKQEQAPLYPQPNIQDCYIKNNNVNILQILTDFKNTAAAIGIPEDLEEEVNAYFSLVETQANKDVPNEKLIKSNLKNASLLLDKYISESLNKNSHVVENWVDTLFLQKVEYKADPNSINPDFLLQFPEKTVSKKEKESATKEDTSGDVVVSSEDKNILIPEQNLQTNPQKKYYVPEDKEIKNLFLKAKKYSLEKQSEKALETFYKALDKSKKIGDTQAQSMIYYETGQIFDKKDNLEQALKNYQKASENATDYNIKTKAHYNMAKIYDDVVQTEPAINHYFVAVSYAGEAENLSAQSKSLVNIGSVFAERYDKGNAITFTKLSNEIANETNDSKVIGSVLSKSGNNYNLINKKEEALSCYKESTRQYKKTNSTLQVARNLEKAASVMLELGHNSKAKKLLKQAYKHYAAIDDEKSMALIFRQMRKL